MSKKVLGNHSRGSLFVISAPAGTGKSTLVEKMLAEFPDAIVQSRSSTTRSPRPGEVEKQSYSFISEAEFQQKVDAGAFLEHVRLFGYSYGTPREGVERQLEEGKHVILVIDTQGALKLMEKESACFIFIHPPSLEELKKRLEKRRTEDEKKIEIRLGRASEEIALAPRYDYQIVNDDLEISYQILRSILIAEEHKRK